MTLHKFETPQLKGHYALYELSELISKVTITSHCTDTFLKKMEEYNVEAQAIYSPNAVA